MIAEHIALVVYDLLFRILSFSSAEAKTFAERISHISSMNSVSFLPMFPVASMTKGIARSTCSSGRNIEYRRCFSASSVDEATFRLVANKFFFLLVDKLMNKKAQKMGRLRG